MRRPRGGWCTVVVVAALVVLAAPAAAVAAAKTVPVKAWSGSVCKDFSRWEVQLTRLGATGAVANPTAGKAAITKFFTGAIKATDRLAKDLKAAGVPAVKHGTAIAAAFASSVKSLRGAYAKAKTSAAALPTGDPATFAAAAQALATQLQTTGSTLTTTLAQTTTQYPASALDKAFTSTKACKTVA